MATRVGPRGRTARGRAVRRSRRDRAHRGRCAGRPTAAPVAATASTSAVGSASSSTREGADAGLGRERVLARVPRARAGQQHALGGHHAARRRSSAAPCPRTRRTARSRGSSGRGARRTRPARDRRAARRRARRRPTRPAVAADDDRGVLELAERVAQPLAHSCSELNRATPVPWSSPASSGTADVAGAVRRAGPRGSRRRPPPGASRATTGSPATGARRRRWRSRRHSRASASRRWESRSARADGGGQGLQLGRVSSGP